MKRSIAIDGPSGAGKSTLARALAERLGFLYVDTGAIYRTVALHVSRRGADPSDGGAVADLLGEIEIALRHGEDGLQHMYLNGEDVTAAIREHRISEYTSAVSTHPQVRAFLMEMQRELARKHDVIMDGRDIGTVVLPDAGVKVFLTAGVEARAERRFRELLGRGQEADYETVLADMRRRDERDTSRETAPLRQAEDAVLLDTTGLTLEESLERLLDIVRGEIGP